MTMSSPSSLRCVAATDTRFGTAHDLMREMERICDHRVIATQSRRRSPSAPRSLLDLLIICPLHRQHPGQAGLPASPTPPSPWPPRPTCATAAPCCIAPSTNDGLAASAAGTWGRCWPGSTSILVPFRPGRPGGEARLPGGRLLPGGRRRPGRPGGPPAPAGAAGPRCPLSAPLPHPSAGGPEPAGASLLAGPAPPFRQEKAWNTGRPCAILLAKPG